MDLEEIVETSDPEEREMEQAFKAIMVSPGISDANRVTWRPSVFSLSPRSTILQPGDSRSIYADYNTPRKRPKLDTFPSVPYFTGADFTLQRSDSPEHSASPASSQTIYTDISISHRSSSAKTPQPSSTRHASTPGKEMSPPVSSDKFPFGKPSQDPLLLCTPDVSPGDRLTRAEYFVTAISLGSDDGANNDIVVSRSHAPPTNGDIVDLSHDPQLDHSVIGGGRYSLRTRQAKQLNPYAYDKIVYKQQMQSNPDAIVKIVSPRDKRKSSNYLDAYEETQEEWLPVNTVDKVDDDEERHRETQRGRNSHHRNRGEGGEHQSLLEQSSRAYPAFLAHDVSNDEESDEEIRATRRQAKEAERQRKRKEAEERKKTEAEKKALKRQDIFRRYTQSGASPPRRKTLSSPNNSPTARARARLTSSVNSDIHESRRPVTRTTSSYGGAEPLGLPMLSSSPKPSDVTLGPGASGYIQHAPPSLGYDVGSPVDPDDDLEIDFGQYSPFPSYLGGHDRGSPIFIPSDDAVNDILEDSRPAPVETVYINNSSPDSSGSEDIAPLDRKRQRILSRMMPAVMIKQQLDQLQSGRNRRHRSESTEQSHDVDEGPMLPGHTRVLSRGAGSRRKFDFKGDSQSSTDDERSPRESTGRVLSEIGPEADDIRRIGSDPVHRLPLDIVELSDSEEESSSDDGISDGEIMLHIDHDPSRAGPSKRTFREGNIIDYMLNRTRTVGCPKTKRKEKARNKNSTNHRANKQSRTLNVVTNGARRFGQGRQTLLTTSIADVARPTGQNVGEQNLSGDDYDTAAFPNPQGSTGKNNPASRRFKKNENRRQPGGLYVFPSNGVRLTSGRRDYDDPIVVDPTEDGFYLALNPAHSLEATRKNLAGQTPIAKRAGRIGPAVALIPELEVLPPVVNPTGHDKNFSDLSQRRNITIDCDIPRLPPGVAFAPDTYIGRGWLQDLTSLVSGRKDDSGPFVFSALGLNIHCTMTADEVSVAVISACSLLLGTISDPPVDFDKKNVREWDGLMHALCKLTSYVLSNGKENCDSSILAIVNHIKDLIFRLEEWKSRQAFSMTSPVHFLVLSSYWFAIEMCARLSRLIVDRRGEASHADLLKMVLSLMRFLRICGLEATLASIPSSEGGPLAVDSVPRKSAEIWICLFHLIDSCDISQAPMDTSFPDHAFWKLIEQALQTDANEIQGSLEVSENIWRSVFALSALSQFSVYGMTTASPRLSTSWRIVTFALKKINLSAQPQRDSLLSKQSLDKRDDYIRLLVSRCWYLSRQWNWPLRDTTSLFGDLVKIFQSRKFANLRRESSDFPRFMLEHNMHLLAEFGTEDTAFETLLKLLVQAARDSSPAVTDVCSVPSNVTKSLSLLIPLGTVPFTKTDPPTVHDLSMLYNRLSAIAVVIYLDPSQANMRHRLSTARRYVNFGNADDTTRIACIRGMMHLAILLQHRRVSLGDILSWLTEMTNVLVDEYVAVNTEFKRNGARGRNICRDRLILTIQVVLGSVRHIIETPEMNPVEARKTYPDPLLLQGPWITRVFSKSTDLLSVPNTGLEIRRLVKAFLDARGAIVPIPPRPRLGRTAAEAQESQDDYGDLDLDLDDPELLVALGEDIQSESVNYKAKDQEICKIIDEHVSPAIYRFICQHCHESKNAQQFEEYCADADKWIDCWVGCANILVQNKIKDWSSYLSMGRQSWEHIIDGSRRRRVGLRFMYALLQLDPPAYIRYNDRFLDKLLESLVSDRVTLEHAYVSLVLSIDGLHHPLLSGIRWEKDSSGDFIISRLQFLEHRLSFIDSICTNLSNSLLKEVNGDSSLKGHNQTCVGFLVTMLSTMKDVYQSPVPESAESVAYPHFCRAIANIVSKHQAVMSQPRLMTWIGWVQGLLGALS